MKTEVFVAPEASLNTAANRPIVESSNVTLSVTSNESQFPIVGNISLQVARGEFLAIVGPSGCGKTSFLNLIAGIGRPTSGKLLVDGHEPVASPDKVMYAFARDALLPWRTIEENITLPLEITGVSKAGRRIRAEELLARVGLQGYGGRYRSELSQGMRQRVSLARSLAPKPELLIMDEPFAALDAQTRILMQNVLLELLEVEKTTVVLVTHDLGEAITLSDRVALFSRRPCVLRDLVEIALPRPRRSVELRSNPDFHRIYDRLWDVLKIEVEGLDGV